MSSLLKLKNYVKLKKDRIVGTVLASSAVIATTATNALAVENTYANNASNWLISGVQALVTAGGVFVCGKCIMKRKFIELVITLVVAGIILAVTYNPEILKSIGNTLVGIIFG